MQAAEMEKCLACKPDDVSSIPRTQRGNRDSALENYLLTSVCRCLQAYTNTNFLSLIPNNKQIQLKGYIYIYLIF